MREIFASFTSSSGSNGSFFSLSLSLSCNRVHLSSLLFSLPRKKDDDSKKKTISVESLTKMPSPLCVCVCPEQSREEEEEERFNTIGSSRVILERGRKEEKDGAQQHTLKKIKGDVFTPRKRRQNRRRLRGDPVVRRRRMGRPSVVLLGIRV